VKTFVLAGASLAWLLAACSGSSANIEVPSTSGGTTGGPPVGIAATASLGSPCAALAVADRCAAAGLVCDVVTATCRKPEMGEQCIPDAGCASTPSGLGCMRADLDGTAADVCLVGCQGSDSSQCPYGTSCYSNYCRAQAPASCMPGHPCSLGQNVRGQCLSDGTSSTCYAIGDLRAPYSRCNASALNWQAGELCSYGYVCRTAALTLGGFADAGFCFPLCADACPSLEHCFQPADAFYRVCGWGNPCSLDSYGCPGDSVCMPDDVSGLGGGCLPVARDAGAIGDPCTPPDRITEPSPCQQGACLPVDGGDSCVALCNRSTGGEPSCATGTCDRVGDEPAASEVVGACF